VRGTFKGIEVKRRGGAQARQMVGSLKPLQDLYNRQKLSDPPPLRNLILFLLKAPINKFSTNGLLFL
jgi:hypothetical protein